MILVDTSVWIDFFNDQDTPGVAALEAMIHDGEDLALCGVILTEILQGIRDDRAYTLTRERLEPLVMLPMTDAVFLRAAEIYRTLRKRGITIRKSIDCMIAAVAIENEVRLLHNDRDFDPVAEWCGLSVVSFNH